MPTIQRIKNTNNIHLSNLVNAKVKEALTSLRKWEINLDYYNEIVFNLSSFSIQLQIEFENKSRFVSSEVLEERLKNFKKAQKKI